MKTIDVCLVTWPNHIARLAYFVTTFYSLKARLKASRHELRWYCSADCHYHPDNEWRDHDRIEWMLEENSVSFNWKGGPGRPPNLGANMNAAMRMGDGDYIFLVQDDWLLLDDVDLSDGADKIGDFSESFVRYSWPDQDGMRPIFLSHEGDFDQIDMSGPWPYGDDPHLRHRKSLETLGYYLEGGGHASASGDFMRRLIEQDAAIFATRRSHFRHIGDVSAVIDDKRPRRVHR